MLGANVQLLPSLPNATVSRAMQLDAAGNIYVTGSVSPAGKIVASAFVAKLSPDGSQVIYFTAMGGSFGEMAPSLALGSDGSAYVAGTTNSYDFPVTAGALASTFQGQAPQGFLAKVNPAGSVVYSTFIAGPASTQITGIALDAPVTSFSQASAVRRTLRQMACHFRGLLWKSMRR